MGEKDKLRRLFIGDLKGRYPEVGKSHHGSKSDSR